MCGVGHARYRINKTTHAISAVIIVVVIIQNRRTCPRWASPCCEHALEKRAARPFRRAMSPCGRQRHKAGASASGLCLPSKAMMGGMSAQRGKAPAPPLHCCTEQPPPRARRHPGSAQHLLGVSAVQQCAVDIITECERRRTSRCPADITPMALFLVRRYFHLSELHVLVTWPSQCTLIAAYILDVMAVRCHATSSFFVTFVSVV